MVTRCERFVTRSSRHVLRRMSPPDPPPPPILMIPKIVTSTPLCSVHASNFRCHMCTLPRRPFSSGLFSYKCHFTADSGIPRRAPMVPLVMPTTYHLQSGIRSLTSPKSYWWLHKLEQRVPACRKASTSHRAALGLVASHLLSRVA